MVGSLASGGWDPPSKPPFLPPRVWYFPTSPARGTTSSTSTRPRCGIS